MDTAIYNRKGARKIQDIPKEVLELLNSGKIETANLTEWLAIDHVKLIQNVFPRLDIEQNQIELISKEVSSLKKPTSMNATKLIGSLLYQIYAGTDHLENLIHQLNTHLCDTIRGYAPFIIALNKPLNFKEKLDRSKKIAADEHFGVREVVWMALRPEIDKYIDQSILYLQDWTKSPNENVRRFATESTRPRGVWCKHIEKLKEKPAIALPILESLKSDPSKYVQDSVGNWLNDASKSKPEFVIELCNKWKKESPTKETEKIIKKAQRTINKAK